MSKFKVGDRVRAITWASPSTGTVISLAGGDFYSVKLDCLEHPSHSAWKENGSFFCYQCDDDLAIYKTARNIQSSRQTLPLSSIHITSVFRDHLPDPKKIAKCYEFYKANGEFNKDIVINMRNVLVDGYAAYLVARMVGMENIPVLQTNSDTLDKPITEKPTEAKPKYYSGKVVCVSANGLNPYFTVGKVYEYRDGLVNCNEPKPYNEGNPAKTKEEALNRLFVTFIEFKG